VVSGTVSVSVDGSDEELRQLAGLLREEDLLRGRVTMVQQPIAAGQMGCVVDVLRVALAGGTASTLVKSLFGWLCHRRTAKSVTLKVSNGKGRRIDLKCGSAGDADVVIRSLEAFLQDGA
jgi:Effector Associated Constant Component 1